MSQHEHRYMYNNRYINREFKSNAHGNIKLHLIGLCRSLNDLYVYYETCLRDWLFSHKQKRELHTLRMQLELAERNVDYQSDLIKDLKGQTQFLAEIIDTRNAEIARKERVIRGLQAKIHELKGAIPLTDEDRAYADQFPTPEEAADIARQSREDGSKTVW